MISSLLTFAHERSLNAMLHLGAQADAIRDRREFCRLKDRPAPDYNPFAPSDPTYTPPSGPAPRPWCPLCTDGIVVAYDGKRFYCDCPAGQERDKEDGEDDYVLQDR